jgi:hypothetical protein
MRFESASRSFVSYSSQSFEGDRSASQKISSQTAKRETARMKNLDSLLVLQKAVQDLEQKLEIETRWIPTDAEWSSAAEKKRLRDFQRSCDKLESLVVARLFEYEKLRRPRLGKLYIQ